VIHENFCFVSSHNFFHPLDWRSSDGWKSELAGQKMQFTELYPRHNDLVHDISFDYYGKRFASCSSDKHIKVISPDLKLN
jgi:WD40 repeat protein